MRDWSDVKGRTGNQMRQLKGSSGTNKFKRWKWRKDNCRRDAEGKEKRAAGGNMMLIREVFVSGQAGSSHQEGKTHLESYQT